MLLCSSSNVFPVAFCNLSASALKPRRTCALFSSIIASFQYISINSCTPRSTAPGIASSEGMMNFANDEEAKKTREEAGVLLDTVVMTPMSGESIINYSG